MFVSKKFNAFLSQPEGSSFVAAIEEHCMCSITVLSDTMTITVHGKNQPVDELKIYEILREKWQNHDFDIIIRLSVLNMSCTHTCRAILPLAYLAVVVLFTKDIRRRSRCADIVTEYFDGIVNIFGSEISVSMARKFMIDCLTEHFGPLEICIPTVEHTSRLNHDESISLWSSNQLDTCFINSGHNTIFSFTTQTEDLNESQHSSDKEMNFSTPLYDAWGSGDTNSLFPLENADSNFKPESVAEVTDELDIISNNVEKIRIAVHQEDVSRLLRNRAAVKKQIERKFNCVITVCAASGSQFGTASVDIMGQNFEQCKRAMNDIITAKAPARPTTPESSPLMTTDSGFSSPTQESTTSTREKRGGNKRNSFLNQPKVLLELTPRKHSPVEE